MNVFKINFDKLVLVLIPTFLRKKLLPALLQAAITPLSAMYDQFSRQRESTNLLLKYNTSRRNVEIVLRLRFGEGIYIVNAPKREPLYLNFYLPGYIAEQGYHTPTTVAYLPQWLDFFLDETTPTADFTIYVPVAIYEQYASEIYDYASYFVLPAFKYNIVKY